MKLCQMWKFSSKNMQFWRVKKSLNFRLAKHEDFHLKNKIQMESSWILAEIQISHFFQTSK